MTGFLRHRWGALGLFQRSKCTGRNRQLRVRRQDCSLAPLRLALEQLESRVLLTGQPDLVITGSAPSTAIEGNAAAMAISWTVKNEGTAAATGAWSDAVYLSSSNAITKTSVFVDSLTEEFHSPLAVGASYSINRVVTLPEFATGSNFLVFSADDGDALDESGTNHTSASAITLSAPNVDLAVTAATLSSSTVVGGDGQQVNVTWTVTNNGTVAAAAGWYDTVYVSTKQTLDSSAISLATGDGPLSLPLAAGTSYTSHATVTVPDLSAGQHYLIFSANDGHQQGESDQADDSNDTLAKSLTVTLPGDVDLAVSGVKINGSTSQQSAVEGNGQSVELAYQVTNVGSVPAAAEWSDGVYLSSKSTLDDSATLLAHFLPPSNSGLAGLPLRAGDHYSEDFDLTIPAWATGTQYLLVKTDIYDLQSETSKSNNVVAVPITLTAPKVDLTVTSASASVSTAEVGDGASLKVSYTVQNIGTTAADGSWNDAIYLSDAKSVDTKARLLDTIGQFGTEIPQTLAAGASYHVTETVDIPDYSPIGSDYLLVRTNSDAGGQDVQVETNLSNNLAAIPITLTAPSADLAVTAAQATPTTVEAGNGQSLNLSWTVTNQGSAAANGSWSDYALLAKDPNYDPSATRLYYTSESDLAAGASYTVTQSETVPNLSAGKMDLVFVANATDGQAETKKSNNVVAEKITLTVPNVNLTISGQAPSTAIEGNTIPVSWTVTNGGSEAAKGSWSDAVYLSDDPTLDDSAVRLTSVTESGHTPLAASGGNYQQLENITIPSASIGQHYLLFVTNDGKTQGETNYGDDVDAVPITLSAPGFSLTSAAVSSPSPLIEGGKTSVSWTAQNVGTVAAPADWYDSVFVSDRPYFDGTTTYVASFNEGSHAGLAASASYTDHEQISIPQFPSGAAYLLFVADFGRPYGYLTRGQPEAGLSALIPPASNIKAVAVTLTAPDLAVTGATVPSSTIIEGASINVSWSVKNLSTTTPALATWYDSVWVSSTPTLDSTSVPLDSFSEGGYSPLAAGASYTDHEQVSVPQFPTGVAYLLFVADYGEPQFTYSYTAGQPQSDGATVPDANDVKAVKVTLTAPDLSLIGATAPTTAIEGANINVSWTVKNLSSQTPADSFWSDTIWVSSKKVFDGSTFDGGSAVEIDEVDGKSPLSAGASYTSKDTISIPQFATGQEYLLFIANYSENGYAGQPESDGGNPPDANDVYALPITLSAPDLATVAASVTSSTITEGAPATVSWTVKDVGKVAAPGTWSDSIYVSTKPTFDDSAVYVQSFDESRHHGLAAGASYSDSEQITLPQFPTGHEYILVIDDFTFAIYTPSQPQSDNEGSLPDANDLKAVGITLQAPDLKVASASGPLTAVVGNGNTINVSYTVKNVSTTAAAVKTWTDALYVSSKATFDSSNPNQKFLTNLQNPAGPLAAGASYTVHQSVPLGNIGTVDKYLLFVTNVNDTQPESDIVSSGYSFTPPADNVLPLSVTFEEPAVDLQIATKLPTANTALLANGNLPLDFTVTNAGTATANVAWTDEVYYSQKPIVDFSAISLSTDSAPILPLRPGISYEESRVVNLSRDDLPLGPGYLLFTTNTNQTQGETNYANDLKAIPITIGAADLEVTSVSAPSTAVAGNGAAISVTYTVKNVGTAYADSTWTDKLYVSDHATFDSDAVLVGTLDSTPPELAPGSTYTASAKLTMPNVAAGKHYLLFVANADGGQREADELSNPSYFSPYIPDANDVKDVAITTSIPNVDLAALSPTASSTSLKVNGTVGLTFTIKNLGTQTASAAWTDAVYLSSQPTLGPNAERITSFSAPGPLAANATYKFSQTVYVPYFIGSGYLLFVTDDNHAQAETTTSNDVQSLAVTVSNPSPPPSHVDFAPTAISLVNNVTTVATGGSLNVKWTVKNDGTATAKGTWYDEIYLSQQPTFDESTAIDLGGFPEQGGSSGLAAGASYSDTEQVTVPNSTVAGAYHVWVYADQYGITDENEANNSLATHVTVATTNLELATATVNGGTSATAAAGNGVSLSVSYTVKNIGSVTANGNWTDELFISSKPTFDATAELLHTFSPYSVVGYPNVQYTPLKAGASYQVDDTVSLDLASLGADAAPGKYYLLFVTNAPTVYNYSTQSYVPQLSESDAGGGSYTDTNNVAAVPLTLTAPNVDLTISNPSTPTTIVEGKNYTVSFTVTNSGSDAANAGWTDGVYFSRKPTFDSSAISLGYGEGTPATLAAGGHYTFQDSISASYFPPGPGYLLLVTNAGGTQSETNTANDVHAVPVTLVVPDLAVTSVTAPSTASLNGTIQVQWTVKNVGSVAAPSGGWSDAIYLWNEPTLPVDNGLTISGYIDSFNEAPSGLAVGGTYSVTQSITIPTDQRTGDMYLIVLTDAFSYTGDANRLNNFYAVKIHISAASTSSAAANVSSPTNAAADSMPKKATGAATNSDAAGSNIGTKVGDQTNLEPTTATLIDLSSNKAGSNTTSYGATPANAARVIAAKDAFFARLGD